MDVVSEKRVCARRTNDRTVSRQRIGGGFGLGSGARAYRDGLGRKDDSYENSRVQVGTINCLADEWKFFFTKRDVSLQPYYLLTARTRAVATDDEKTRDVRARERKPFARN